MSRLLLPPALGWWTWAAMLAVLGAAAVLSFAALRDLAELCGIAPALAPLLPVAIDAGAAVGTRVWLSGQAATAERFARRLTLALLATTVAGNALHSALLAAGLAPAWWVAVLVGAIPPAVVGGVVHLAVLAARAPGDEIDVEGGVVGQVPDEQLVDEHGLSRMWESGPPAGRSRAAELIESGAGRRRLARELDISEHEARALLAQTRNGAAR